MDTAKLSKKSIPLFLQAESGAINISEKEWCLFYGKRRMRLSHGKKLLQWFELFIVELKVFTLDDFKFTKLYRFTFEKLYLFHKL